MGVFQARDHAVSQRQFKTIKKASEAGADQTSASSSKPGTSKQTDDLSSEPKSEHSTTQHPNICTNLWRWTFVVLFLHRSDRVFSPSMAQIQTDQIMILNNPTTPTGVFGESQKTLKQKKA